VPTVAESGLPRFQFESWFGLLAPGKTPPAVVAKLNAAINKVLARPEIQQHLLGFGVDPDPMTVAEFNKVFLNDRELMAQVVKESGITKE
jgi:tripartite-type tricarboxylate transporter receptor subunit TctC